MRRHVVLVVSDGTGVTGERVVQAALTQFDSSAVLVERISDVRDVDSIARTMADAERREATVLFSMVTPEHRRALMEEARRRHIVTIDLLGPILLRLSEVLAVSPLAQPGLFHQLDEEYFRRIDAIDFALRHDDGKKTDDLDSADLVLIGVSRTSKTPLSVFLANRGWHIANIPVVLRIEPPQEVFDLPRRKVVALTARPSWLESVRQERAHRIARGHPIVYSDPSHIREELQWFREVVSRGRWTVVDVTNKAIEETASEIVNILRE